jgi:hypothetical protein
MLLVQILLMCLSTTITIFYLCDFVFKPIFYKIQAHTFTNLYNKILCYFLFFSVLLCTSWYCGQINAKIIKFIFF